MLQNSPSIATHLTIFWVIFINWHFEKWIYRSVDRFSWRGQNFSNYYFPPNVLPEATIERCFTKQLFCISGQKPWKISFKDVYIQIQEVTILKNPQEELINWYLLFATLIHHGSVILMLLVTQSCNKTSTVRSGIDAKN